VGGGPALLDAPALASEPEAGTTKAPAPYRRFVIAAVVGMGLVTVPYLYVLWDLFTGEVSGTRPSFPGAFYEDQARALVHGHLWIPYSQLGIEAFFNGGRAYTYFGLFPSLIRLPFMALFPHLGGKMTAPSLLAAWVLTGVLSALLVWRLRILIRGSVVMGWAEAVSLGALMAAITGGSVLIYLAANPWVYDEDLAWSVALTLGAMFCLLGVLERPSWRRILVAGGFILCADLNRLTTGWACVIGAVLVAGWFWFGKERTENRRWAGAVLAAGLVPLFIGCAVNSLKFGGPFTLPMADQQWTHVNPHRRLFLAANGGKGYNLKFLPSTLTAYFQPDGMRLSSLFPFITLPSYPARTVGNAVLDQTYATGSVPDFMPLLFLSGIWGLVTSFRPKALRGARLLRPLLLAAAAATAGVMLWGYIADRYIADFMPLLILAGVLGMLDLWRRLDGRSRLVRSSATAVVALLALFGVLANTGASLASFNAWNSPQVVNYVDTQKSITPGATAAAVRHGSTLPYWAPAETLYDVGNCSGFYFSSGISFANSPGQQLQHETWVPIEQGKGINTSFTVRLNEWPAKLTTPLPVLRYGRTTVVLEAVDKRHARFRVVDPGPSPSWPGLATGSLFFKPQTSYRFAIMTDPYMHAVEIAELKPGQIGSGQMPGLLFNHYLAGNGPARLLVTPAAQQTGPVVRRIPSAPSMSLCHRLG
jgi:hypothetical protein